MELDQLVEKITDEVIRDMKRKGNVVPVDSPVGASVDPGIGKPQTSGKILVIISGDPKGSFAQGSAIEIRSCQTILCLMKQRLKPEKKLWGNTSCRFI